MYPVQTIGGESPSNQWSASTAAHSPHMFNTALFLISVVYGGPEGCVM